MLNKTLDVKSEIQRLKDQGYTVRIQHVRKFPNAYIYENTGDYENMMTKGEFIKASQDRKLFREDMWSIYNGAKYGLEVSPTGGFTSVVIQRGEHLISKGKKNFTHTTFNRKIGVQAALGHALKVMGNVEHAQEVVHGH